MLCIYSRPNIYHFCQIFQALCLYPTLRLLRTLEYLPLKERVRSKMINQYEIYFLFQPRNIDDKLLCMINPFDF